MLKNPKAEPGTMQLLNTKGPRGQVARTLGGKGDGDQRQVTTVAGATSVSVHCQFTSPDRSSLFERDANGKVRFFVGNLKATYDSAKKAAHITNDKFSNQRSERNREKA